MDMRGITGILLFGLLFELGASGQSMLEAGAAVAGGTVGGVAGKKVSDGLTRILGKVDAQTAKAAKATKDSPAKPTDASAPLLEVGPGMPKSDGSNVPPPPPVRRASARRAAPAQLPVPVIAPPPVPYVAPPPPPQVSREEFEQITAGTPRAEVLKLGSPASRITMFEDGHLLEIYRYETNESTIGSLRLIDGAVSTVKVN
jgi:hypothetical protein